MLELLGMFSRSPQLDSS